MSIKEKRVIIVGGTSGIGLSTAKAFLNEFAQVVIASRSASKLSTARTALGGTVEGLVRGLAADLAPIRVNVVSPSIVDTPVYAGMSEEQREGLFASIAQQLPVGRIAKPEDIAESYLYLAKNGFTTGSVVLIDGGAHLV